MSVRIWVLSHVSAIIRRTTTDTPTKPKTIMPLEDCLFKPEEYPPEEKSALGRVPSEDLSLKPEECPPEEKSAFERVSLKSSFRMIPLKTIL